MTRYRQLSLFILVLVAFSTWIVATRKMQRGLDLAGGMRVVYEARPAHHEKFDINGIARVLERRINYSGVAEPVIQPKGDNQVVVEIPDVKNKEEIAKKLVQPTNLEFRYFAKVQSERNPGAPLKMSGGTVNGQESYTFIDPQGKEVPESEVIKESPLILTGADLQDNAVANLQNGYQPVVQIQFKPEGTKKFADFTRRHVGDLLAMVLNGHILSAPKIDEPILNGEAVISGGFKDVDAAQQLAQDLNSGALPVPLVIVEQNVVEATLGQQYVHQSITAGMVGLALVVAFMIIYYLLPGFLATLALGMYALFTFAIFKLMGVTMTLPGLAGFILSIGMAVDANILIFERTKEELRAGKTLFSAIDAGFSRAWTAILDSNVCTLITCLILLTLTTGPVKGFAMTLGIGVLVSMFTAITVTRTLLHMVTNMRFAQNPKLYGLGVQWAGGTGGKMDIMGKSALWFSISGLTIVLGLFFLFTHGLKRGIEFTGGTMVQASFVNRVTSPEVTNALKTAGFDVSPVQISVEGGKDTAFIRTRELNSWEVDKLRTVLSQKFTGSQIVSSSFVGPSISKEITQKAIMAVVLASLLILGYLSIRFSQGGFADGFKFGACALAALLHDVLVVLGASALFGKLFGWEIDGTYVTAVLTMIGFSVHDTIVIFDRIRENMKLRLKGEDFQELVNRSILQSFARSVNTSFTVIMVLVTLLIWGGAVIRHFNAVLVVGITTGTYSSIFNASPLLVIWERLARKRAGGTMSQPSLKPLVQKPTASALRTLGEDVEEADAVSYDTGGAGTQTGVKTTRPKTAPKRRKRRF